MLKYYDIRKLKELNVKFLPINIQRRKHELTITQKKKGRKEHNKMDHKYQDIHVTNWQTNTTRVIREVEIKKVTFTDDSVIFELTSLIPNIFKEIIITIPKNYNKIRIH